MGKVARSQEKAEQIWKDYENGRAYQSLLGLDRIIPLCVDFYEGRQWGKIKKGTENFPRPVVNFIKIIFIDQNILEISFDFYSLCKYVELSIP